MNKEKFIDTLQACYFGDKGAFNLILKEYEELHNKIDKAIEYIEEHTTDHRYSCRSLVYADEMLKILKDSDVDE